MKEDRVELALGETITINEVTYKCTRCTNDLPIINELMLDFQCGKCEVLRTLACGGLNCQPDDRSDGEEVVFLSIN